MEKFIEMPAMSIYSTIDYGEAVKGLEDRTETNNCKSWLTEMTT